MYKHPVTGPTPDVPVVPKGVQRCDGCGQGYADTPGAQGFRAHVRGCKRQDDLLYTYQCPMCFKVFNSAVKEDAKRYVDHLNYHRRLTHTIGRGTSIRRLVSTYKDAGFPVAPKLYSRCGCCGDLFESKHEVSAHRARKRLAGEQPPPKRVKVK